MPLVGSSWWPPAASAASFAGLLASARYPSATVIVAAYRGGNTALCDCVMTVQLQA